MSAPRFDIFETYAREQNARILKASEDARLQRSLLKRRSTDPRERSTKAPRSMLMSIMASLIYVLKQLPV